MKIRPILLAMALVAPTTGAFAQEAVESNLSVLPQACRAAVMSPEQAMPQSAEPKPAPGGAEAQHDMSGMDAPETVESDVMDGAQQETVAALDHMHAPMMAAAKIADADLAFNCGMIAHHQGAIDMALIELKYGKDADSRKMAEMIIEAQTKEIAEMSARVSKLAKR